MSKRYRRKPTPPASPLKPATLPANDYYRQLREAGRAAIAKMDEASRQRIEDYALTLRERCHGHHLGPEGAIELLVALGVFLARHPDVVR